ncbi:MAG: protoporphyrinogen oxidase HemJ [Gammaproteobacteria bacterium]
MFEWLKALHIIAVVTWFAALFYLPRLFVYHAMADEGDTVGRERFKVMERKLYRGIMTPSAIAVFVLGIWLLAMNWDFYKTQGWMHAKLTLVFLLYGYHGLCGRFLRDFANDRNTRSHVFYRVFNELPVLVLIAVVILVVVRPFAGG